MEQKQNNWADYTARTGIRLTGLVSEDRNDNWTGYSCAEMTAALVIVGQMITILVTVAETVAAASPTCHLML